MPLPEVELHPPHGICIMFSTGEGPYVTPGMSRREIIRVFQLDETERAELRALLDFMQDNGLTLQQIANLGQNHSIRRRMRRVEVVEPDVSWRDT